METPRYLEFPIRKDCLGDHKMAFISGPRQVGKTTMALHLAKKFSSHLYCNWDDFDFRKKWAKSPSRIMSSLSEKGCLILDEIHKAPHWKNAIKGLYDLHHKQNYIIVTGSAKLDTYKRGGDSLMGRYFHFRLHPYSLGELHSPQKIKTPHSLKVILKNPNVHSEKNLINLQQNLIRYSGFPQPYGKQTTRHLLMWQKSRLDQIVHEDLRDLTRIQELSQIDLLIALLPERVGSLLSLKSLAEDLEVSQPTIKTWLGQLEKVFFHYSIRPFSKNQARAIKKTPKIYLWDWSLLKNQGKLLENFTSSHLLKAIDYWNQLGYGNFSLHYYQDKEKREVDFILNKDNMPWLALEVKNSELEPASNLKYFIKKWPSIIGVQLIEKPNFYRYYKNERIHVISMANFLAELP